LINYYLRGFVLKAVTTMPTVIWDTRGEKRAIWRRCGLLKC